MPKDHPKQERFPPDDVEPAELEALTLELRERVVELSAIIKLAKVTPDIPETVRQIGRLGIRAHEIVDRIKGYAKRVGGFEIESTP